MKTRLVMAIGFVLLIQVSGVAQIHYPFQESDGTGDILAYWYSVPEDSVKLTVFKNTLYFHSSLQIYGKVPAKSFQVEAKVYLKDRKQVFHRVFDVAREKKEDTYNMDFRGGFFRLTCPVDILTQNPGRIEVTIRSPEGEKTKEIQCRYHKLYGKITDFQGNPFRGFVWINPDAFGTSVGVWSDASGNYEIEIPERTYNSIAVDDESYAVKTTETWAWHIIMDADQNLDFKVGTGEVYNLNVWPNNGGGDTYFISFRPMALHLFQQNMGKENPFVLDEKTYNLIDIAPDLKAEDITVTINGKTSEVISLQRYYETAPGTAMNAYLVQVNLEGIDKTGKQTVVLEYRAETEVDGETVVTNSMGYFQYYSNYYGLSHYF